MKIDKKSEPIFPWRAVLLIVVAGLLAHGLVLFTDYVLWDGIWINKHLTIAPRAFDLMERMWREGGLAYNLLWQAPMKGAADPAKLSKFLSVSAWILSAVFFFLFLRMTANVDPALSLMAAVLAVCAPFIDVLGDLNHYFYVMPVCFFWAGMLSFAAYPSRETKLRCLLARLLALALLFISFSLASNLVFFCAVLLVCLVARSSKASWRDFRQDLWVQFKSNCDFAALPFVSWIIRRTFFPAYGHTDWYNQVSFDVTKIFEVYGTAFRSLFEKCAINVGLWWIWAFALLLGVCSAVVVMRRNSAIGGVSGSLGPLVFLLSGVVLWLAAVFPYAAVGQYIHAWGWPTRSAILFHVPLGLFASGALVLLARVVLPCRPRAAWLPVAMVAGFGIGMSNASYLRFQAQGAKQQVFAQAIRDRLSNESNVSLVQLRDYFPLPYTFPFYPAFIWTYLAAREGDMPRALVVDTGLYVPDQVETDESGVARRIIPELDVTTRDLGQLITDTTLPFVFENVPRNGRQFLTVIAPGSLGSDSVALGAQYLMVRYLQPQKLSVFLSSLATVQSREISGIKP